MRYYAFYLLCVAVLTALLVFSAVRDLHGVNGMFKPNAHLDVNQIEDRR